MLTWLNEKFVEWRGFESWQKTAYGIAFGLFLVLFLYGSYEYLAFHFTSPAEQNVLSIAFWAMIYFVLVAVLGSIGIWLCGFIGVLFASVFQGFSWCYRKICL